MDSMLFSLFMITVFLFLLVFLAWSLLMLSCFIGKSIRDPTYPPVTGTVVGQLLYFHRLYDHFTQVAKTHKTFRLVAPDRSELYTTDPGNIEHILKTQFDHYIKGQYNRDILQDLFGQSIVTADGEDWKQQRKLASNEFSTRILRDFSCSVFRRNSGKLVRVISEFSSAGVEFDIQDILMRCTMDSIIKIGFGVELSCLEGSSKEGSAFMKAYDDSNAIVYWRYVDPSWKLKRFLNIGSEATLKKNISLVDDFVHGLIRTRREKLASQQDSIDENDDKEDILSRFLVDSNEEDMNDRRLRDRILSLMVAGKDTSANTLSWFFYMLCKHPLIQERIVQEVKEVTRSHESEENVDMFMAKVTDSTLEKMHYLHATLTETLRLYPAIPVDGRIAERDDTLPDGYRLKKGDAVFYLPYSMGRMNYIWGDDAEEFRPERWLKDGVFQPESPFKFIAFNAGPRICLGKDFAYRQMKIVSMALLRFFRFKLANETKGVTYKTMFTLHIDKGLHLCAVPR